MDIIVTVPKKELKNVDAEEKWSHDLTEKQRKSAFCFWSMNRRPKRLEPGDRVYFIQNGFIVNSNEFLRYEEEGEYCEVTDRYWKGPILVMDITSIPLKKPVPMKGFQGFRYTKRIE